MNQRAVARGRSSGTDGCDFSYRMVVDSRYTKVAKAKSRLAKLIFAQVVTQLIIEANVFVSLIKKEPPNRVSVSSLAVGFVSIMAGELGRKRSRSYLLKFYAFGSSTSILSAVAYLAMSNLSLGTFQNFTSLDTLKVDAVLLGFVVQLFAIDQLLRNLDCLP
ncbi:uncharacterized protein [Solanum tuberosum]|uniref:uncharacterized protein isoform X2 n=1 Tax=Solanum tuberosum TaxID=4113 RepID=UPI00073A232B|nr:PREDICTED: uncharacterized protein LOC102580743 isoform X2 [Solanum tuberosum]